MSGLVHHHIQSWNLSCVIQSNIPQHFVLCFLGFLTVTSEWQIKLISYDVPMDQHFVDCWRQNVPRIVFHNDKNVLKGVHKKLCFFLKILCFFWTLPVLLQRWFSTCLVCVHTLTPKENRERPESGIFLKNRKKTQNLMNTLYFISLTTEHTKSRPVWEIIAVINCKISETPRNNFNRCILTYVNFKAALLLQTENLGMLFSEIAAFC